MIKDTSKHVATGALIKTKMQTTAILETLYARYFFVAMASAFIIMAVIGFGQDYQLIFAQHISLTWFDHVHGALLTAWLFVFLTQSIMAAKGNLAIHRKLGQFSVVLGV